MLMPASISIKFWVALLAEGVDRNSLFMTLWLSKPRVALLAEGVDRNFAGFACRDAVRPSPSSRRAWIEIDQQTQNYTNEAVALLAEGVDRNILSNAFTVFHIIVALLAEGVDRNLLAFSSIYLP